MDKLSSESEKESVLDWFASLRPVIGLKISRKLLNQSGTKLKPCAPRSFAFSHPWGHLPLFLIGLKISHHPLNQSGGKTKTKCGSIFPPLQVLTLSSHWFFQMLSFIRIKGSKFQSEWRRAHARYVSLETLYGGQFTSSTELIKPNYLVLTGLAHSCFSLHLIGWEDGARKLIHSLKKSVWITGLSWIF